MKKIKAFVILTRPINVIIGCLSIFIGAFIAGSISPLIKVMLAMLSGGIIAGAANSINDFYDVAIDAINKPYRPIPAGLITKREAFVFSIILFITGIFLGALINWKAFLITLFASLLLYFYSARLKRTVLWGNLSVSLITAFAFIYGGVAVNRLNAAIIPAVFSFLFHLGREIIKDVEDQKGDLADNANTLPLSYGAKVAFSVTTFVFILLIIATFLPYIFHIFGMYYLWVVLLGVDLVIIYVIFSMWWKPEPANLGRLSTILKMDMLIGLFAIYVGRF